MSMAAVLVQKHLGQAALRTTQHTLSLTYLHHQAILRALNAHGLSVLEVLQVLCQQLQAV